MCVGVHVCLLSRADGVSSVWHCGRNDFHGDSSGGSRQPLRAMRAKANRVHAAINMTVLQASCRWPVFVAALLYGICNRPLLVALEV